METILYSGAVLTGFMISQTYNYFFGYSNSSSNGSNPVHTNINIHTNTTPQIENKPENENINIPIPKSLLYDIVLFQNNNKLKSVETEKNMDIKQLTFENELKQKMAQLREKTQPIIDID